MTDNESHLDQLLDRWETAREQGHEPSIRELCSECPELQPELARRIRAIQWANRILAPPEEEVSPPEVPKTLGRYELKELLAEGGFGFVWRAFDPELERYVAIKVLRADRGQSVFAAACFLEEAKRVAQLRHTNIVSVYDVGRDQGHCYIVSELIEGCSLREVASTRTLNVQDVVAIVSKTAAALQHAHDSGVIHRDIKPANILLSGKQPFIADFGIATSNSDNEASISESAGTPAYMSPEQAGMINRPVDSRTDIFSLGLVLYELLTGKPPFERPTTGNPVVRALDPPLPVSRLNASIPRYLDEVCRKAIEIDPDNRFLSAAEFSDAVLGGHSLARTKILILLGLPTIAIAIAIGFATGLFFPKSRSRPESGPMMSELEFIGNAELVQTDRGMAIRLADDQSFAEARKLAAPHVGTGDFTVAAWIMPFEVKQAGIVSNGGYNWKKGWVFDLLPDGSIRLQTSTGSPHSNGEISSEPGVIQKGVWQHVAASVKRGSSGNLSKIFVNGKLVAIGDIRDGDLDNPFTRLYVGRCDQYLFSGLICDVSISKHSVSQRQLEAACQAAPLVSSR